MWGRGFLPPIQGGLVWRGWEFIAAAHVYVIFQSPNYVHGLLSPTEYPRPCPLGWAFVPFSFWGPSRAGNLNILLPPPPPSCWKEGQGGGLLPDHSGRVICCLIMCGAGFQHQLLAVQLSALGLFLAHPTQGRRNRLLGAGRPGEQCLPVASCLCPGCWFRDSLSSER